MEKTNQHLDDLSQIRSIMERSTKFLSLSGWSGIFAGIFGLAGAIAAWFYLDGGAIYYDESFKLIKGERRLDPLTFMTINALITLVLALSSAFFFSWLKARKNGENIWTPALRSLIKQLALPLAVGGVLALILIYQQETTYIAAVTLIFYGLALFSAGRYTSYEIIYLGIADILLGLAAAIWQDLGIYFWAIGFGVFHIIYGLVLYTKYDLKK